jgi:hypothetical protein
MMMMMMIIIIIIIKCGITECLVNVTPEPNTAE